MARLISAKIDVKKIDKDLLYKGEKGTYLSLSIWINDQPDEYGNDVSIQQKTDQGEPKIYLGNGKFLKAKESKPNEVSHDAGASDNDDLPF